MPSSVTESRRMMQNAAISRGLCSAPPSSRTEPCASDLNSLSRFSTGLARCYSRLFEWPRSLEDATAATELEPSWPKGWLRRATAELRLVKLREALTSLRRGFSCAQKTAGQFLPLSTECEALSLRL